MDIQMQFIPARCGHCGYLYPSGYGFDPSETGVEVSMMVFENAEVPEPCPMCGRHRSRVLAREYQFVRDAERLLRGSDGGDGRPGGLAAFLQGSGERVESPDEARERAAAEAPELSGLVEELLEAKPERMDGATWRTLLLATARALEGRGGDGDAGRVEPGRVIYDSVNRYNVTTVQPSRTKDEAPQKVGRNDPCPCGSGKKYKKCHGSPTGAASTP